jgi:hypothetical protein
MTARTNALLACALPLLLASAPARAAGATEVPAACAGPAADRPPDPRCNETLDGRPAAGEETPAITAPRLLLRAPQLATRAAFWPVLEVSAFVESHRLYDWARAILTSDDGRLGLRPELIYSSGFIPTAGARVFYHPAVAPGGALQARFHTAGASALRGELDVRGPASLGLWAGASWDRRHDRLFAGVGSASAAELAARGQGLARYRSESVAGEVGWARQLPGRMSLDLGADLQRRDYGASAARKGVSVADLYGLSPESCAALGLAAGCVDPAVLPGFDRGVRLGHLTGALALDLVAQRRDGGGLRFEVDGSYAHGVGADPSRHLRLGAETVAAVGGIDRALLLRLRAAAVEPLGRAPVPFDELCAPAGTQGLRGFPDGRFRDRSALVASLEYRWFIAFNLDGALFVDAGTVAGPRFAGLGAARLYPDVGLGLRRSNPGGPYWQARVEDGLQIVYSREAGVRVLLSTAAF